MTLKMFNLSKNICFQTNILCPKSDYKSQDRSVFQIPWLEKHIYSDSIQFKIVVLP